jgi:hypothetical protein
MTMIREHAFNSVWWGDKAGFVEDAALFALPDAERDAILRDYAWVEYVAPIDTVAPAALLRASFMQTDVQIVFKLDLRRLPPLPDFADLSIASAAEEPFHIGDDELGEFEHERFRYLPGITPAKLKDRYRLWANALIDANPEWSLRIAHEGKVQGWFLSELDAKGFHLTLAALHRDATTSGLLLYQQALATYARRGQRVGGARFSVANPPVHNIYAHLGARFLSPYGCWLWLRPSIPSTNH